jgi:ABC-type nitrate/sulfonate/bicarbonate transport system substrate-binding protein
MNIRPVMFVFAVGLTAIGAFELFRSNKPEQRAAQVTIGAHISATLQLDGPIGPKFAGALVALKAGLFEREKLQVNLIRGEEGVDSLTVVANSPNAIGVSTSERFLTGRDLGLPIVAFAAEYLDSPVVFYSLERSKIRTPFDFIGKRIGYQANRDSSIIYRALMNKLNIPRSKVEEASIGMDVSALANGEVDVLPGHIGREGFNLQVERLQYSVVRPSDYGLHVPGSVYFTAENTIRNKPEVIQKFLRGAISGWEMTYTNRTETIPMILDFGESRLTPQAIQFGLEQQLDFVRPPGMRFGEFDDIRWRTLRDILVRENIISPAVGLPQAITYEFLREVYRRPISFGK